MHWSGLTWQRTRLVKIPFILTNKTEWRRLRYAVKREISKAKTSSYHAERIRVLQQTDPPT